MSTYTYVGQELDLFARAVNWKRYLRARLRRHLRGQVLEVGAGTGGTTAVLCEGGVQRWLCLEPDAALAGRLFEAIDAGVLPGCCQVRIGVLADLGPAEAFDAILYMDVVEHIEDDAGELAAAAQRLQPGGRLIVLSPAHMWLYSPFDKAVGHYRRYTTATLRAIGPPGLELDWLGYLDAVGMAASMGNRFLLEQRVPTAAQIAVWDRLMVPLSRLVDPCLGYRLGKSVLGIWRRP